AASHINVLELRTVTLALRHFLPRLSGQHVLVRTDNTSTLAYINQQGGVRSPSLHHWANCLLLWAAVHIRSLRAVHIPVGVCDWLPLYYHAVIYTVPYCYIAGLLLSGRYVF